MIKKSTVSLYHENGLKLILVKKGSNAPKNIGWLTNKLEPKAIENHIKRGGNLGFSVGQNFIVLDIDPRNGGNKSWKKLKKIIGNYKPNTLTPRGGPHIYFKLPKKQRGNRFRGKLGQGLEFEGIDVIGDGKQVVIPTSDRPEFGVYRWGAGKPKIIVHDIPQSLLLMIQKGGSKAEKKKASKKGGLTGELLNADENRSHLTEAEVWALCKVVPNNKKTDYQTWLEMGMALHDWNPTRGGKLWNNWSKQNKKKHNEKELTKKYASFSISEDGVTIGTLIYRARDANFEDRKVEIDAMKETIFNSSSKFLKMGLLKEIKDLKPDREERRVLASALRLRYKRDDGTAPSQAQVEARIAPAFTAEVSGPIPEWAEEWLYVTSHSAFLNTETRQMVKREGFDLMTGFNVPPNPQTGAKASSFKYCADHGYMTSVSRLAYVPFNPLPHFIMEGTTYGNLFNPQSVPDAAKKISKEGKAAIKLIKDHFMLITDDKKNAKILIDWIAHNVQYLGEKILWTPLIQSIEGTGKTFLGQLLTSCIGNQNVGIISPSIICSDFNDYAMGSAVGVFQELRIVGQNRYEVVNAVKPLITDHYIAYHPKGAKGYTVMNTTNYIATTNFKDAVPLEKDDRRWFVIFMAIQSLDEMEALTGKNAVDYFADLFAALQNYAAEIKLWLLERDLTEFRKIKTAPMTVHKMSMIATENTGHKGVKAVEKMLALGGNLFNVHAVNLQALYERMLMENVSVDLSEREKISVIKRLGYTLHPDLVEVKGTPREFWTKAPMTDIEIITCLKKRKMKRIEG